MKSYLPILLILLTYNIFSQTVYTKIDPAQVLCSYGCMDRSYEIDFNDDDIVDLKLWFDSYKLGAGCNSTQQGDVFVMQPYDTALIFFDTIGELAFFNNLDTIKEATNYSIYKYYCENGDKYECPIIMKTERWNCETTPRSYIGHYAAFSNKYIGLILKILDDYHYCWIKVFKEEGVNLEIKSIAYNETSNKEIVINDPDFTLISTNSTAFGKSNIFPNPIKDILSFDLFNERCTIQITDLSGVTIHKKDYFASNLSILTDSWKKGIYIVSINYKDSKIIKKIIKQ